MTTISMHQISNGLIQSLRHFVYPSIFLLVGCANFDSVHRDFNVSHGNGALIDIKQRAIIATEVTKDSVTTTRVCAEPSPDALSAYAAEISAKASNSQASAGLNAAFQEGSAFVGMRTQSIQILRDFGYRLCESYLSGAISEEQYEISMRRFQKNVVALIAIEQLTGTISVPPVSISTSGKVEEAKALSELRTEREKIGDQLNELATEKDDLEKNKKQALEKDPKSDLKDIDKRLSIISGKTKRLEDDIKIIDQAILNSKGMIAEGKTIVEIKTDATANRRSDEHIQTVAKVVAEIVTNIIGADDGNQVCLSSLQSYKGSQNQKDFIEFCKRRLEANTHSIELLNTNLEGALKQRAEAKTSAEKESARQAVISATNDLIKSGATVAITAAPKRLGDEY